MAESSKHRRSRRKWLRRILRGIVVVLGLLILLAAIAPSLLFSRPVERRISRWASQFLGRPVVVEDIDFGWRTPLRAGRISLPAIAGEENYPLLDIRGVSIPLTLSRIAMLPPYSLSVDVDKIEFNLVKMKNGETNLLSLLSRFSPPATNSPAVKPATGSGQPPVLPLKDIRVNLRRIDVRYVDMPKGMVAGMENVNVSLDWRGGKQPLTGKLSGSILLNRTRLPWELGINLNSWVNAGGTLTLESAALTVDSGGGTNAPIFLDLSMAGGHKNVVHAALPLALIGQVNKAMNLVPVLPELAGGLDLRLVATHEGGFKNWDVSSTLLIKDVKVTGAAPSPNVSEPQGETPKSGEAVVQTNAPGSGAGFDGSLGIAGRITLNTSVALPQPSAGALSPLKVTGEVVTEINSLDLTAGKVGISLCDFIDRRHFDVTMDPAAPADLTYTDDAHSGLSSLEGSMGVAVGKCALDAKARYSPPGIVFYDIRRAEVDSLAFTSPALQLNIPPVKFSGSLSARLKDCAFEGKDLQLFIGDFFTATCQPFFNWTNGDVRISADARVSSLSNALAMAQIRSTNATTALPQLAGGLSGSINLHGRVPKTGIAPGDPLPIAGDVSVRLNEIGVDLGPKLAVRGVNAAGSVNLSEDGRDIRATAGLQVANVAAGSDKVPPLTNIHLRVSAAVHDFNRVEAELNDFGIDSLHTAASARMTVGGILASLSTNATGTGPMKWLHALDVDFSGSFNQDLKGVTGIVPDLDCDGNVGVSFSFKNSPLRSLSAAAGLTLKNVRINWANTAGVSGVNGAWSLTKTFLAPGEGRRPASPPQGRIMIDSAVFKSPKLPLEMHKAAIDFQGLEQDMKVSAAVPDMIGGPIEAACSLTMRGSNPGMAAKITVTGLNGGALFPGLEFKDPGEGDINAVADISLVLPPDSRGTLLDNLGFRLRTMRIGKNALVRILKAMDSRQETPQFQNAITALSLGTPVGVEVVLANSLVTINAELLIAGGVRLPLPILDSAPLSDIMGVYKLEGTARKLDGLRQALLLLMTNDLTELEKSLARAPQ